MPEGDAAAFSLAVQRLLDNPEERRGMGEAAAARIFREHDLAAAAKAIDERLRRLVRAV